jgi:predicted transcriptional regulator
MTLQDVVRILDCQVVASEADLNSTVASGCGCDLMSDVLTFAKPGSLLLTGLCNIQAIRTAEMSDIKMLCFVRAKQPTQKMISLARRTGITVLTTSLPLFEACGRLYANGLTGIYGR